MIMGSCPYPECDAPLMLACPEHTPTYGPHACETCGRRIWTRYSRLDPWSMTESAFLATHEVDEAARTIRPLPGAPGEDDGAVVVETTVPLDVDLSSLTPEQREGLEAAIRDRVAAMLADGLAARREEELRFVTGNGVSTDGPLQMRGVSAIGLVGEDGSHVPLGRAWAEGLRVSAQCDMIPVEVSHVVRPAEPTGILTGRVPPALVHRERRRGCQGRPDAGRRFASLQDAANAALADLWRRRSR